MQTKKHVLRTYEITFGQGEQIKTISVEGASISAYALGDNGSSAFAVYGEDNKTPVVLIAWDSFIFARMTSEMEVLKVKRLKKIVDLRGHQGDEKDALT